jgi:hypothetical protein
MTKSTKNTLSIIVMCALALTTVFVVTKYQKSTLKEELTDFAVEDTASIDKIFLSDKDGYKLLLERKENYSWSVNKSFEARPDAIKILLETIKQIKVKAPVGRASFNNVVKKLAVKSTKVEIYQKGKLVKTYYVGGTTEDFLGNYMMIENSSAPFIIYIPGFDGYLYPRYYAIPELWRSTALYRYKAQDIASVKFSDLKNPTLSWELSQVNTIISLKNYKGEDIARFDTLRTREFLTQFYNVNCEGFVKEIEPERKDSILNSKPRSIFKIVAKNGETSEIKCFNKKLLAETFDMNGKLMDLDVDRFYGMLNDNKKDLLLLQNFVFDNLLVPVDHFAPKTSDFVKK